MKKILRIFGMLCITVSLGGCNDKNANTHLQQQSNTQQEELSGVEKDGLQQEEPVIEKIVPTVSFSGMNSDGTMVACVNYPLEELRDKNGYYHVSLEGEILKFYENIGISNGFINGQAIAWQQMPNADPSKNDDPSKNGDNNVYGLIDIEGNWILEPTYGNILPINGEFFDATLEKFDEFGSLGVERYILGESGRVVTEYPLDSNCLAADRGHGLLYLDKNLYHVNGKVYPIELFTEWMPPFSDLSFEGDYLKTFFRDVPLWINKEGEVLSKEQISMNQWVDMRESKINLSFKEPEKGEFYQYYKDGEPLDVFSTREGRIYDKHMTFEKLEDNKEITVLADLDGNILTDKAYTNIFKLENQPYFAATEMRANGEGGYKVLLDSSRAEYISTDAKIKEIQIVSTGSVNEGYVYTILDENNQPKKAYLDYTNKRFIPSDKLNEIVATNLTIEQSVQ